MNYQAHPGFHTAPTLARNQYSDVQSHRVSVGEMEPAGDTANVDAGEGTAGRTKRLSRRAEKAPEGLLAEDVCHFLIFFFFDFCNHVFVLV